MNLLNIRKWFITESGRYDLVIGSSTIEIPEWTDAEWADNGANNYLSAAQRMLDRMQETDKSEGFSMKAVSVNNSLITLQDCRFIQKLYAIKVSDETRSIMYKKDKNWIKEQLTDANASVGTPKYYSPAVVRLAPEKQSMDSLNIPANLLVAIGERPFDFTGLIFSPAADEDYVIEVQGMFYSPSLTSDTDETYWTSQHPELLVMAGQLVLEKFNRNTEGAKDWESAIRAELLGIDRDLVSQDIAGVTQMEG